MYRDFSVCRGVLRKLSRGAFFAASVCVASPVWASESVKPDIMFRVAGLPVTNSMITAAIFCILLVFILRFVFLRGGVKLVPSKGQMAIEAIIDGLGSILLPVMGSRTYRAAAPYLLCLFTFILAMNWSGMLPGVGTIGYQQHAQISASQAPVYTAEGFAVTAGEDGALEASRFVPFIRPAHTDMNMTLALALISFLLFFYFVGKYAGFGALFKDWFGNKANKSEVPLVLYYALFPIFFAAGFIEIISTLIRPISLSFRLFGNVFGGETLLTQMHVMATSFGGFAHLFTFMLPLPFYFLELLVGIVQAFVFTLLTALYIGLITNHESEDEHSEV